MRRTWWERVSCVCSCSPGRPGKLLWSSLPLITNPPQPSSSSGAQLVIRPTGLEPVAIIRHWISPSWASNLFCPCLLQEQPDSLRYEDGAGPRGQRGAQSGRQVARPRGLSALQRSTVNSHGVPGWWEKLYFSSILKQKQRNPDWQLLLLPQACAPISHSSPLERVSRWRMQESFLWLLCPWI